MEQEPRLVLAGDPETGEIYAAQVIDEEKRGHGPETLPMVRIMRVARYPDQRAIQHPETALDLPALDHGQYIRMAILKELTANEREAFLSRTWKESLRYAQKQALREAKSEKEKEIVRRHLDGEYRRRRRLRSYTRDEIRLLTGK